MAQSTHSVLRNGGAIPSVGTAHLLFQAGSKETLALITPVAWSPLPFLWAIKKGFCLEIYNSVVLA